MRPTQIATGSNQIRFFTTFASPKKLIVSKLQALKFVDPNKSHPPIRSISNLSRFSDILSKKRNSGQIDRSVVDTQFACTCISLVYYVVFGAQVRASSRGHYARQCAARVVVGTTPWWMIGNDEAFAFASDGVSVDDDIPLRSWGLPPDMRAMLYQMRVLSLTSRRWWLGWMLRPAGWVGLMEVENRGISPFSLPGTLCHPHKVEGGPQSFAGFTAARIALLSRAFLSRHPPSTPYDLRPSQKTAHNRYARPNKWFGHNFWHQPNPILIC